MTNASNKIATHEITIRPTQLADANQLPKIEQSAGELFSSIKEFKLDQRVVYKVLRRIFNLSINMLTGLLLIMTIIPLVLSLTQQLPESVFIHELSVSKDWQNKGIGKLLIQTVKMKLNYSNLMR